MEKNNLYLYTFDSCYIGHKCRLTINWIGFKDYNHEWPSLCKSTPLEEKTHFFSYKRKNNTTPDSWIVRLNGQRNNIAINHEQQTTEN